LDEDVRNLAKEFETAQRLGLGTGKSNVREMKNSLAQDIEKLKQQIANPVWIGWTLTCVFVVVFDDDDDDDDDGLSCLLCYLF
jgi:hypothetical protein